MDTKKIIIIVVIAVAAIAAYFLLSTPAQQVDPVTGLPIPQPGTGPVTYPGSPATPPQVGLGVNVNTGAGAPIGLAPVTESKDVSYTENGVKKCPAGHILTATGTCKPMMGV